MPNPRRWQGGGGDAVARAGEPVLAMHEAEVQYGVGRERQALERLEVNVVVPVDRDGHVQESEGRATRAKIPVASITRLPVSLGWTKRCPAPRDRAGRRRSRGEIRA